MIAAERPGCPIRFRQRRIRIDARSLKNRGSGPVPLVMPFSLRMSARDHLEGHIVRGAHAIVEALQLTTGSSRRSRADHHAIAVEELLIDEIEIVVLIVTVTGAPFSNRSVTQLFSRYRA